MSDLIAVAYDDLPTAERVLKRLEESDEAHEVVLDDWLIVERREDGTVKLHQPSVAAIGAVGGGLWGGLIGLIFFAPLLGAALGAAAGAAAGALTDPGINDDFLRRLGEQLEPGKAAVILLATKAVPDKLLPRIKEGGVVVRTSLSDEDEAALRAALAKARQASMSDAEQRTS